MENHRSLFRTLQTVNCFQQFFLSRAGDAGDSEDLPAVCVKGNVIQFQQAFLIPYRQVADLQPQLRIHRIRPVNIQRHRASDHHIGHFLGVRILRDQRADIPASTEYRHLVRQGLHFIQLVRDDHDGFPVVPHIPQNGEQLVCFLRRQHGGGLVQDQDIRSAVQHFDNLHRLLLGNRHIINLLARIHVKTVSVADLPDLLRSALQVQFPFQAQHDVLRRAQNVHQLKMLVNHSDPQFKGFLRGSNHHRFTVHADRAGIREIDPREHIHQGRLPAAVFSQQRQDLSAVDVQGNVIVGQYGTETFVNVSHFHCS